MLSEISAECQSTDPTLVVPWSDPARPEIRFIDLSENPYDLDRIPEAEQHPALLQALRALNTLRSPVFTAKCDAWPLDLEEAAALRINLDVAPDDTAAGFASYIDLLARDRSLFVSFHRTEQLLQRLARLAAPLDHPFAMLDCIIRPAFLDLTLPQEGFAISLYLKALGSDESTAHTHWSEALAATVALLRSKNLSLT